MFLDVKIYIWVFNLIPLISEFVFMPILCGFYYYSSRVELKPGMVMPLAGFFFII